MTKKMHWPFRVLFVVLIISILAGCGSGVVGDPTATGNAPTLPPAQPTIIVIDGTPQVIYQEQFATPTLNLAQAYPVQLTELKFIQSGTQVSVMAKMRNTIADAIAKDVQFEIIARDEDGNRLHQDSRVVKYIFPAEVTGLSYVFELMPGFLVKNVELRVISGVLDRNLKYHQPLTVRVPSLQKTETESHFTAWLDNADPYTYTQVRLNAIAYNKAGEIIGGGTSIVDFVPHKESIGVNVPVQNLSEPEVAWVEVYPWITQYSASLAAGRWWETVQVKDWNFEVNEQLWFSGGAVLKNLSKNLVVDSFYILTLSDEQGRVVKSDMGYIDYIWPEEEVLFSPGAFEVPFTEEYPDDNDAVTSGTAEADDEVSTTEKPTETSKPSSTPKPAKTATPKGTSVPSKTVEPSKTPEENPYPQGRGIGVLARQVIQDPYPIDDPTEEPEPSATPGTPETSTKTQSPTKTPVPTQQTTPQAEETPGEGTVTPTPTPDAFRPNPIRHYPQTFVVDLIVVPGEFSTAPIGFNPLKASQAAFVDENTAKVSVVNNLNVDLPTSVVYVLVYDAEGQIVGGGKTLSETIRTSSATEVLVPIAYLGDKQALTLKAFVGLTKNTLTLP